MGCVWDSQVARPGYVSCYAYELPPLKWSSLKYDFVGGLFDGEEAYG